MPVIKKRSGRMFAGSLLLLLLILLSLTGGCSGAQRMHSFLPKPAASSAGTTLPKPAASSAGTTAAKEAATQPGQPPRFEIIYEHGETKNLGGFTVIRDNATGQEYLAVIGLNGSSSVIPIKTPASVGPGAVR